MPSTGLALVVLSGLCNGVFTSLMKLEVRWKWENIWAVFILTSCLAMPWLVVGATVPGFSAVFSGAPQGAILAACVFGFGWGFGAICFGRSVDSLGVSVANSLVLGVSSALGSLVPLLMTRPAVSFAGLSLLLAGIAMFLIGVGVCGSAGRMRDKAAAGAAGGAKLSGYLFAIASGVMSATFNIGYTLAQPIAQTGVQMGHSQAASTNCIWLLMLGFGAIPNLVYCAYLMRRNHSAPLLVQGGSTASWMRSALMGLLWGGSIFLYGAAAPKLGDLGPSVGWPLSLAVALLVANLMGVLLGEWRAAGATARRRMNLGIWILMTAIALCAVAARQG